MIPPHNSDSVEDNDTISSTDASFQEEVPVALRPSEKTAILTSFTSIRSLAILFVLTIAAVVLGERALRWVMSHLAILPKLGIDTPTLISLLSAGFVGIRFVALKIRDMLSLFDQVVARLETEIQRNRELSKQISRLQNDIAQLTTTHSTQVRNVESSSDYVAMRVDHNETRIEMIRERLNQVETKCDVLRSRLETLERHRSSQ